MSSEYQKHYDKFYNRYFYLIDSNYLRFNFPDSKEARELKNTLEEIYKQAITDYITIWKNYLQRIDLEMSGSMADKPIPMKFWISNKLNNRVTYLNKKLEKEADEVLEIERRKVTARIVEANHKTIPPTVTQEVKDIELLKERYKYVFDRNLKKFKEFELLESLIKELENSFESVIKEYIEFWEQHKGQKEIRSEKWFIELEFGKIVNRVVMPFIKAKRHRNYVYQSVRGETKYALIRSRARKQQAKELKKEVIRESLEGKTAFELMFGVNDSNYTIKEYKRTHLKYEANYTPLPEATLHIPKEMRIAGRIESHAQSYEHVMLFYWESNPNI